MVQVSKTFRIFISSTFNDLINERNALQKKVFPIIKSLCIKHGCRFQAIDLRWGVREEAALDQRTIKICIEEIERCRDITPRPNFMIILGDRYGWRPLPYEIPAEEFEAIKNNLSSDDNEREVQKTLLERWYWLDKNAKDMIYILQPRRDEFINSENWKKVEEELYKIISDAIKKSDLNEDTVVKYLSSATEQEIIHGALAKPDNLPHVFCFFRRFDDTLSPDMGDFVDLDEFGKIDIDSYQKLKKLKEKLRSQIPHQIYNYKAKWQLGRISEKHINKFCKDVKKALGKIIKKEIKLIKQTKQIDLEIQNHQEFAKDRRKFFRGRQEYLNQIEDYIMSNISQPLVLFGESGSGKTALIAKSSSRINKKYADVHLISRFIGATPRSSDGRALLEDLCKEINRFIKNEDSSVPLDYKELSFYFNEILKLTPTKKKLVIYLDALDQLSRAHDARELSWIPETLPQNVKIIVSTLQVDTLNKLKITDPKPVFLELRPMLKKEGEVILDKWLEEAGRTLQSHQREEILKKFEQVGLPLYLKICFEEGKLWKSYSSIEDTTISSAIPGIIRDIFKRLSKDEIHGSLLVSHSLAYLAASRNGLTEDELIDLLSMDREVVADFKERAHHIPPEDRLPVVVWSRFYFDLEPYLTERIADDTTLLDFYHRQLSEVVEKDYLSEDDKILRYNTLAKYFAIQDLEYKKGRKTIINLRKISEFPYCLSRALGSKFKDKDEERDLLLGATECLIKVGHDFTKDLAIHAEEIEPIINSLFDLKEYEEIIKLLNAILAQLEKLSFWQILLTVFDIGIKSANVLDNNEKVAEFKFGLSKVLFHMAQYKDAITIGEEALDLAKNLENKRLQANLYWHIGAVWRFEGDRNKSLEYYSNTEEISRELKEYVNQARCLIDRGIIKHGLGHFKEAKKLYDNAIVMLRDEIVKEGVGERICNLYRIRGGLGYDDGSDLEFAKESWETMARYAEQWNIEHSLTRARARLSLIEGNIKKMKAAYTKELNFLHLTKEKASELTCYGELAEIYIREGNMQEAKNLCDKAEPIAEELNNLHSKSGIAYVRGIRAIAEGNIDKARRLLEESEKLFADWTSPYRYWVSNTLRRLEK